MGLIGNAPASKELLTYRIGDGVTLLIDNAAHDNFFSAYYAMGMPVNCRNVAISGGSECGIGQPYGPYALLFKQYSNDKTGLGAWMNVIDLLTAVYQVPFGLTTNRPLIGFGSIFGVLSFKTSILINFQANALPDHSAQQIYKGQLGIQRKILGLIKVNSNITNRNVQSTSSMLPLDSAPGGQISFSQASSVGIPSSFADKMAEPSVCYVPTTSALNIGGGTTVINTAQLNAAYSISHPPTSPYNSPFARFVTAVKLGTFVQQGTNPAVFVTFPNENHLTYTSRSSDFILRELRNDYTTLPDCSPVCSVQPNISGPANFCTIGTYSLTGTLPAGSIVNWTVSGPATAGASTTGTVTLTANGTGLATIGAIIYSNCSFNATPSLTVYVGLQTLQGVDYVDRTPQASKYVYLTSTVPLLIGTTAANYTWYQEINNVKGPQIGSGLQLRNYPIPPASVLYFRCEAVTSCGTAIYRSYAYNSNTNNAMVAEYTIFPNPAASDVSIMAPTATSETTNTEAASAPAKPASDRVFDAYLINDKGVRLRIALSNKNIVHFNISDIPDGLYYIHIHENGTVIKKELWIKR